MLNLIGLTASGKGCVHTGNVRVGGEFEQDSQREYKARRGAIHLAAWARGDVELAGTKQGHGLVGQRLTTDRCLDTKLEMEC